MRTILMTACLGMVHLSHGVFARINLSQISSVSIDTLKIKNDL